MRWMIMLAVLAVSGAAYAQDAAAGAFPQFCEEWMQKLAAREQRNVANIKWAEAADGVSGEYIGYGQEHTCVTKTGTQSVPVGKITYREVRYEKHGGSVSDAEKNPPQAVETTEITEIFRYSAGKWIY